MLYLAIKLTITKVLGTMVIYIIAYFYQFIY